MKKKLIVLIVSAMSFLGANSLAAQSASDQVTLNVKLYPIQTLVVGGSKTVDLEYKAVGDYADGVSSAQANHLKVYSTGGFEIKASSKTDLSGSKETIELSDIKLTASKGGNSNSWVADVDFPQQAPLTAAGTKIASSSKGGVDLNFDVLYEAAGGNKYINLYRNDENPTTFTTEVTYTITAQ